jgi:hypothetical protein
MYKYILIIILVGILGVGMLVVESQKNSRLKTTNIAVSFVDESTVYPQSNCSTSLQNQSTELNHCTLKAYRF